ncbi:MAG: lysoplasmalogenase [Chloroflexi bacterium]|nr:lysoplasmalogenase [Chloroflexota bacterium]
MAAALLICIALCAAPAIYSSMQGMLRLHLLTKPLTTILIIVLAASLPATQPAPYRALILAGLVFSLAGDIFLMLPRGLFTAGLAAFFIAHLCYIAAFWRLPLQALWALPVYALYVVVLMRSLWRRIGVLTGAVLGYAVIISLMSWLAWSRYVALPSQAALLAGIGSLLFIASDSILAYDRFVGMAGNQSLGILVTYYAAQTLIALSV